MTYFYRRKPEKGAIPPKGEEKRRELLLSTVPRSHQSQERDARHDAQHAEERTHRQDAAEGPDRPNGEGRTSRANRHKRIGRPQTQHGVSGANALDGVVIRHVLSLDSFLTEGELV